MASLDDIWDAPAESSARPKSPPRTAGSNDGDDVAHSSPVPAKRLPASSRPLFYDSGSDNDAPAPSKSRYAPNSGANKPDIDALFDGLDDDPDFAFQDLAPSLDVAALKRKAEAKIALTPHQILPSSSPPRDFGDEDGGAKGKEGEKKSKDTAPGKKKKRAILDEGRLMGPDGFPALVKQAKDFKPKGKGHELQDLNRLLNVYQFWAHKMYPHTHFSDTVQRVEKLCHSKRMNVALSVWRDEAKGLINGHKMPGSDDSDSDDEETKNSRLQRGLEPTQSRGQSQEAQDVPIATDDERSSPTRSTHDAPFPPSSPSSGTSSLGALDEDFDIDAMLREEEAARTQAASSSVAPVKATYGAPRGAAAGDEDEEMWDAVMGDFPDEPYIPPAPLRPPQPTAGKSGGGGGVEEDMDEDMWDMVREMEDDGETYTTAAKPTAPAAAPVPASAPERDNEPTVEGTEAAGGSGVDPSRKATNDEGWDEMYA
ncbi:replication fork protection component Swi3-domain-containing protein [Trametes meyenii]|nr:replication fork protection component Swi3-domain-containing protein [Trametes meyenii]